MINKYKTGSSRTEQNILFPLCETRKGTSIGRACSRKTAKGADSRKTSAQRSFGEKKGKRATPAPNGTTIKMDKSENVADDPLERKYRDCVAASERDVKEMFSRRKESSTIADRLFDSAERLLFGETLKASSLRTWKEHGKMMCQRDHEWRMRMSGRSGQT